MVITSDNSYLCVFFFFFKQKTAYEIGTGDWSSDVCSSDLRFNYYGLDEEFLVEPRVQGLVDLGNSFKFNFNAGAYYQYLNPVVVNNSLKLEIGRASCRERV